MRHAARFPTPRLRQIALCAVLAGWGACPSAALAADPAKQADILTLMDLTGAHRLAPSTAESLRSRAKEWAQRSNPQHAARAEQLVMDNAHKVFAAQYEAQGGLRDRLVPVYDRLFSHADLREIIAFYRTPSGTKLLASLPAMQKETQTLGVTWGREVIPMFVTQANNALKSEGLNPMDAQ